MKNKVAILPIFGEESVERHEKRVKIIREFPPLNRIQYIASWASYGHSEHTRRLIHISNKYKDHKNPWIEIWKEISKKNDTFWLNNWKRLTIPKEC